VPGRNVLCVAVVGGWWLVAGGWLLPDTNYQPLAASHQSPATLVLELISLVATLHYPFSR